MDNLVGFSLCRPRQLDLTNVSLIPSNTRLPITSRMHADEVPFDDISSTAPPLNFSDVADSASAQATVHMHAHPPTPRLYPPLRVPLRPLQQPRHTNTNNNNSNKAPPMLHVRVGKLADAIALRNSKEHFVAMRGQAEREGKPTAHVERISHVQCATEEQRRVKGAGGGGSRVVPRWCRSAGTFCVAFRRACGTCSGLGLCIACPAASLQMQCMHIPSPPLLLKLPGDVQGIPPCSAARYQ